MGLIYFIVSFSGLGLEEAGFESCSRFRSWHCWSWLPDLLLGCWCRCRCWVPYSYCWVLATLGRRRLSSDRRSVRSYSRVPTSHIRTSIASPSTETSTVVHRATRKSMKTRKDNCSFCEFFCTHIIFPLHMLITNRLVVNKLAN